jgi:hypothetical protein
MLDFLRDTTNTMGLKVIPVCPRPSIKPTSGSQMP